MLREFYQAALEIFRRCFHSKNFNSDNLETQNSLLIQTFFWSKIPFDNNAPKIYTRHWKKRAYERPPKASYIWTVQALENKPVFRRRYPLKINTQTPKSASTRPQQSIQHFWHSHRLNRYSFRFHQAIFREFALAWEYFSSFGPDKQYSIWTSFFRWNIHFLLCNRVLWQHKRMRDQRKHAWSDV